MLCSHQSIISSFTHTFIYTQYPWLNECVPKNNPCSAGILPEAQNWSKSYSSISNEKLYIIQTNVGKGCITGSGDGVWQRQDGRAAAEKKKGSVEKLRDTDSGTSRLKLLHWAEKKTSDKFRGTVLQLGGSGEGCEDRKPDM